ncbi:serine/threonine protein kinase [Allocoleopsis franciscana]|uniref:non-specific serine/threonine protein kinase n=1 Tax=Allocoleopsis franciscana PCC 7113 TaxID=1173027 RepID=K9WG27_9CYAN|nr:serine/threonine-protein kinase [Allocoleopsis franciscana]AFZ19143.1 serine/threonine protein kinase [Allocoleopsis franciscana PCC 7113]
MHQSVAQAVHCINPDCPRPYPQPWGNKFCNGCGAALLLNNRYIPLQKLGTGGFAAIYTIWDMARNKEQVLKVLVETAPKALQLFEQEASVLQRLKHPGIPRVEPDSYFTVSLGYSSERLLSCLVMEKINGQTLQDVFNDHPQGCSEQVVRDWIGQAVEILGELHRCGIIHRDIKPSNLMLREGTGQLVTIDFGGAKQFGSMSLGSQKVSTRLVSPGYSPPEQITGEAVGPTADFYALGRTMIQLLTGQELEDLQDPETGELRWRSQAVVTPALAGLLDDLVRLDPQQRPATVAEIQRRLDWSAPIRRPSTSRPAVSFSDLVTTTLAQGLAIAESVLSAFGQGTISLVRFVFGVVTRIVFACLDTTLEMVLGGLGATTGAALGFALINGTIVGDRLATWIASQQWLFFPQLQITEWRGMLMFAIAGWSTAWGLTLAGGFGQERRFIVSAITGIVGYTISWFIWQATGTVALPERLLGLVTAVGVLPLVLGLGLPSHYLVHAFVAALGTGTLFGGLVWFNVLPAALLIDIFSHSGNFIYTVAFFGLWGVILAFWMGVSYYILVPVLRWFGWR